MDRGRTLRLLGGEPAADDEGALVEAEVHRRAVERERAREEGVEAGIRRASGRGSPAEERSEVEERPGDEHRQPGDEVDVRVRDRVDPLAGVAGAVEPVRVRRLDLDHSCTVPTVRPAAPVARNFQRCPLGFGTRTSRAWKMVRKTVAAKAPVADPHHARAHPDRRAIPVAHARLRGLVLHAVRDLQPDRDPVRDERDVEDEQAAGGEPEGALREAFAGERPPDDAGQDVPAEARGDQRPAADDHQMRVREVADEVARVARRWKWRT